MVTCPSGYVLDNPAARDERMMPSCTFATMAPHGIDVAMAQAVWRWRHGVKVCTDHLDLAAGSGREAAV